MKTLNQYIQEKLIINKDYREVKIVVKSFAKLRKIIEDKYDKLGPGTEHDPIDFNDIDVSNINSFYSRNRDKGIFQGTNFKYIDISDWDVSNVTNMMSMFFRCEELESVGDISKWDVSNVTNMGVMFFKCEELESVGDISKWDVSKVTNMSYMFAFCKKLESVGDISKWNVSKVRYKIDMFDKCPIKNEYKPKFK